MVRYRLRYQSIEYPLPEGDFIVGRSSTVNLPLDDALASRRHALFRVNANRLSLEDLGSRNGIAVNGQAIHRPVQLADGDRVTIGAQELVVVRVEDEPREGRRHRPTLSGQADLLAGSEEVTAFGARGVVGALAEKLLALGRYDEAERMLGHRLEDMLREAQQGRPPSAESMTAGTDYALRLAEGLKKAEWLDWLFELHRASGVLMDADATGRLHDVVQRTQYRGGAAFSTYVAAFRDRQRELSANDRFLLHRLESLERAIAG